MRDQIKPVDPLAVPASARSGKRRPPAAGPWFAGVAPEPTPGAPAPIAATALAKRARPTSSFEGFGSFSG